MTVVIRNVLESEVGRLQRFIDDHWQRGHILGRDEALLRWQFRSPDAGILSVLVAEDGDEWAGMVGLIPAPFNVRGEVFTGAAVANWLARPEWRGSLVGLQLLREAFRQFDYVGGLGAGAMAEPIYRSLRCAFVPLVPRWAAVVDERSFRTLAAACGASFPADGIEAWIAASVRGMSDASPTSVFREVDETTLRAWDALWREHLSTALVGVNRSADWLRWRYLDHPAFRYRMIFAVGREGRISGLACWRLADIRDRPERVLRVVELLGDEEARRQLLMLLRNEAREAEVAFIDFQTTLPSLDSDLASAGWVRESEMPVHLPALFAPLDHRRAALNLWGRWARIPASEQVRFFGEAPLYFTRADCDQDRPS